ncbi:MAG: hypothetical protein MJ094_00415 [Saccharofermentans sp.]|nr:hypothetical protein [Saccharofermentans sp.]
MTKININKGKVFTLFTAFFAVVLIALVCFFLRYSAIGCHDSFGDFIFAREHSLKDSFLYNLDFNLARGRVGILFTLVSTLRFAILKTGNITAIWLLQQVPTWFTVGLIAWMIGKKTKPVYGLYFACFYAAYVQIDTNHNLMVCYPLDFVYGISMMAVGFYLYDAYLEHKSEKHNVWRLVFSVFCYYESMLCYEPFITTCLIYGLLSLARTIGNKKSLGRRAVMSFIVDLIPHAVATIVFFGILNYVKAHPIIQTIDVTPIDEYGTLSGFLETWRVFSTGVIPFSTDNMIDVPKSIAHVFDSFYNGLFSIVAALALISMSATSFFISHDSPRAELRRVNLRLLVIGIAGLIFAVFFTVPHALTSNYQYWVSDLNATGYLTSSMCYFGWAICFSCITCLVVNLLSMTQKKLLYCMTVLALAFGAFVGAEITVNMNNNYADYIFSNGIQMSFRGQVFYTFVSSEYSDSVADLLYIPDYSGVHGNLQALDEYADFELGKNVMLERNSDAISFLANYYGTVGYLNYFPESDAGCYLLLDNPIDNIRGWVCSNEILIISTKPGVYTVSYMDALTGNTHVYNVELGRCDTAIISEGDIVIADSLTIDFN